MKHLVSLILLALSSLAGLSQPVVPAVPIKTNVNINLAWDISPSLSVGSYILRRGSRSGTYLEQMTIQGRLTSTATWSNAVLGVTNFFMLTAVGTNGIESDPSNEVGAVVESRPQAPNLRTAVPVSAMIESKGTDGIWKSRYHVGPLYVLTDDTNEVFRMRLVSEHAVEIMPDAWKLTP